MYFLNICKTSEWISLYLGSMQLDGGICLHEAAGAHLPNLTQTSLDQSEISTDQVAHDLWDIMIFKKMNKLITFSSSHPSCLTCRASNRTGGGSNAGLPPWPAPSLSDWSSLGWVNSDTHSCSSHGNEPSSSTGVRGTSGECVHGLFCDDATTAWEGEDTPSLCLQFTAESCGVNEPVLLLPSGCRRRSCTSGRGAWVVTKAP